MFHVRFFFFRFLDADSKFGLYINLVIDDYENNTMEVAI